jgi:hypothetical protein
MAAIIPGFQRGGLFRRKLLLPDNFAHFPVLQRVVRRHQPFRAAPGAGKDIADVLAAFALHSTATLSSDGTLVQLPKACL